MKKKKGKRWKSGGYTHTPPAPQHTTKTVPITEAPPPSRSPLADVDHSKPYDKTGELPRRWVS